MPTLKFYNPATSAWEEVSSAGAQGPPGPGGATGPAGPTGTFAISTEAGNIVRPGVPDGLVYVPDQVIIGGTTPLETSPLWVDEATATPVLELELNDLTDVTLSAPADGNALVFDAATGQWVPGEVASGGDVETTIDGLPLGAILSYPSVTPPTDWLLCDGSAIPATYTQLIALVGANTPDLRGKFVAGAGGVYAVGATGGEDAHTLIPFEQAPMQVFREGMDVIGHGPGGALGGWTYSNSSANTSTELFRAKGYAAQQVADPHENRPPFHALAYIIKAVPSSASSGGGGGGTGADEVVIGSGAPTDAAIELWVDLDDDSGTGGGGGAVGPKVWAGMVLTKIDGTFDEPMTGATFTEEPIFFATITTANGDLHGLATMDPTFCSATNVGGKVSYFNAPAGTWVLGGPGWAVHILAIEAGASLASVAGPQAKPEESKADANEMVELLYDALMSMPSGKKALAAVTAARAAKKD